MAAGHWPGEMGPGYTDGLSRDNAHVYQLYYEQQNPKLPPPEFAYLHNEQYVCAFCMHMDTRTVTVSGISPELVHDDLVAADIPNETDRDTAHTKSLTIVEERFQLTLPQEQVLDGVLPAALIKGQPPT